MAIRGEKMESEVFPIAAVLSLAHCRNFVPLRNVTLLLRFLRGTVHDDAETIYVSTIIQVSPEFRAQLDRNYPQLLKDTPPEFNGNQAAVDEWLASMAKKHGHSFVIYPFHG